MTAGLFVDRISCIESEDSADDIYLVAFRGTFKGAFRTDVEVRHSATLKLIAGAPPATFPWVHWTDFDGGEAVDTDVRLFDYSPDDVYVVMLAERDADNDLTDNGDKHLHMWRAQLGVAWRTYIGGLRVASGTLGEWRPTAAQLAKGAKVIAEAMNGLTGLSFAWPVGDDDDIGSPKHLQIAPGSKPTLQFKNVGGGNYKVRFKIA
jgi:hypothetical protein